MNVVELRRYALRPGRRDELIDLFDRQFVESQEACGMSILGQFRDLDDPDSFVWVRGFADMETRRRALTAFYSGPVWNANSARANATMLDVGNVLLLRPESGHLPLAASRDAARTGATVYAAICYSGADADAPGFRALHAENTFPALPVRDVGDAAVWFGHCPAPVRCGDDEVLRLAPTARSLIR